MVSVWLTVIGCSILLAAWFASAADRRRFAARQDMRSKVRLFSRECLVSGDGRAALALDRKSRQLLVVRDGGERDIVSYDDLAGVELLENGRLITRICRERLAPPGDPAEASSRTAGQDQAAEPVRSIVLGLAFRDGRGQRLELDLLGASGRGVSARHGRYCELRSLADRWCAMLQPVLAEAGGS
jgi:hypothetical protein